jgi:hypothetical protein
MRTRSAVTVMLAPDPSGRSGATRSCSTNAAAGQRAGTAPFPRAALPSRAAIATVAATATTVATARHVLAAADPRQVSR